MRRWAWFVAGVVIGVVVLTLIEAFAPRGWDD